MQSEMWKGRSFNYNLERNLSFCNSLQLCCSIHGWNRRRWYEQYLACTEDSLRYSLELIYEFIYLQLHGYYTTILYVLLLMILQASSKEMFHNFFLLLSTRVWFRISSVLSLQLMQGIRNSSFTIMLKYGTTSTSKMFLLQQAYTVCPNLSPKISDRITYIESERILRCNFNWIW